MIPHAFFRYQALLQEYVDLLRKFREQSAAIEAKMVANWAEIIPEKYRIGLVSPDQFQPQDVLEIANGLLAGKRGIAG